MGKKRKRRRSQQGTWFSRNFKYVALAFVAAATVGIVTIAIIGRPTTAPAAAPQPNAVQIGTPPVIALVGDSYTAGFTEDSGPGYLWADLVAKTLEVKHQNLAVPGVGYVTPSADGDTFATQAQSIDPDAAAVIVFGSRNDRGGYDAVRAAAAALYASIRETTDAPVLVIGPAWSNAEPTAEVLASRDAVRDAAATAGFTFVDPLTEGWFAKGVADRIGEDGIHPTDAGHAYLAAHIQPLLAAILPK